MTTNKRDITTILNTISSEPDVHNALLKFLANGILTANSISPTGWVIYEIDGGIIFSIRNVYTISIGMNLHGDNIKGVSVLVADSTLTKDVKTRLDVLGCSFSSAFVNTGGSSEVKIPYKSNKDFVEALRTLQAGNEKYISNVLKPGKSTSWKKSYNPAITQFLRKALSIDIPNPAYYSSMPKSGLGNFEKIDRYLKSEGYFFSENQISSFYVALQTKGFVILSGISGTGKTKLAQKFAEMLPLPTAKKAKIIDELISITLQPDHILRHRFIIPKQYLGFFEPVEPNKRVDINLNFRDKTQQCWLKSYDYSGRTPYLMFWLQGDAIQWIKDNFKVGDVLNLKPEIVNDKLSLSVLTDLNEPGDEYEKIQGNNCLFLSVRPDWRDSKSLLGYYNPLTKQYEMTPFLEFMLKAKKSYEDKDGLAWFVILDEMNLARVEYYFADLLSVIESGRDIFGNTNEPLRFIYGEIEEGEVPPPAELTLPPNLYFIGTVNVDETTQSFSPKVLDRAFCLEFTDVNFNRYTSEVYQPFTWVRQSNSDGKSLLIEFTQNGSFARIDKDEVNAFIKAYSDYGERLQALNQLLQPYSMHFGHRVFDEIVMYLSNADHNNLKVEDAFDQAVLMKVLPKFHGSRGKLEKPLMAILVWCSYVQTIDDDPIKSTLLEPEKDITPSDWKCPLTAKRVLRMFQSLKSTGFASFG